ncbi:MAG: hypothetical protein QXS68_04175 [Candidatus Methanomethylicaceae archaeon]
MLLEQYRRCAEDWRRYDSYLWQIPSFTFAAAGAILTLVLKNEIPSNYFNILMVILGLFIVTMIFSAMKTRFFQEHRAMFAEDIERRFGLSDHKKDLRAENQEKNEKLPVLKVNTEQVFKYFESKEIHRCSLYKISAFDLQFGIFYHSS